MKILWRVGAIIVLLWMVMVLAPSSALAAEAVGGFGEAGVGRQSLTGTQSSSSELLTGGDERQSALEVALSSPGAVSERAASRTRYEGLGAVAAVGLAEKTFDIQRPGWEAPGSAPGSHIERYLGSDTAVEVTPNGSRLFATSSTPLVSSVGTGKPAATSLELEERAGVYVPKNPVVPVSMSAKAAGGVALPFGYGVAPVGAASGEASRIVGDSVVYPGTATDTMFVVEPVPEGVEASWLLLSQEASGENALRFALPEGASLRLSETSPDSAEVVKEGQRILLIPPASAMQADGVALPVAYSVSGDVLGTHVDLSGSVDFPVRVDPVIDGAFGTFGPSNWVGWTRTESACKCFGVTENEGLLRIGEEGSVKADEWGQWYISAPGAGSEGGSLITRVDLTGLSHQAAGQSYMEEEMDGSNGRPVWTFDGFDGAQGEGSLVTSEAYSNVALAMCADGAGGKDGSEDPLCNENYGANSFVFEDLLGSSPPTASTYVQITGAVVRYLDTTAPNQVEILIPKGWVQHGPTEAGINGHDQGIGMQAFTVEIPPGYRNAEGKPFYAYENGCYHEAGFAGCPQSAKTSVNLSALETGVYSLGVRGYDAVGNVREEQPAPVLHVDHTAPHLEPLSGTLVEHANNIGSTNYTLNLSAADGNESAPQSGMHTIKVWVDGRWAYEVATKCSEPTGVPSSGCYSLSGTWTMNGANYAAGLHTVTVTAKDWAGNETTETLNFKVAEAGYTGVGPGEVNLESGNFKLSATDVNVASAGAALTVSRTFESHNPSAGTNGPLGSGWMLSLPDSNALSVWQQLEVQPNGNVDATMVGGTQVSFARSGSSYVSPAGYQTETLAGSPSENPTEFTLTNAAGDRTTFQRPEHETGQMYMPVRAVQASDAGGLNKVSYVYEKTAENTVRPVEMLAPSPPHVECEKELARGCRALTFNYATATTATGESEAGWGDYKGLLTRVYLHAWNPKTSEMTTTTVAQYAYDSKGRLRAEWNPQVSPALKTIYGYGTNNEVTALTQPGQQTWTFSYATTGESLSEGRLIKAYQAPAGTLLWKGESVTNTEAPKLEGSPVVGGRIALTGGKWTGDPVGYAYRWEICLASFKICLPIAGANNADYTPTSEDTGWEIVGQIVATNASGSVTASTAATTAVSESGEKIDGANITPQPGVTIEYNVPISGTGAPNEMSSAAVAKWGQKDDPATATAILSLNVEHPQGWPASSYARSTIYYLDSLKRTVNVANPAGGISTTEYNAYEDVERALTAENRAAALAAGEKSVTVAEHLSTESSYTDEGRELVGTLGPEHEIKLPNTKEEVMARKHTVYSYDEGAPTEGGPYYLLTKTVEKARLGSGSEVEERSIKDAYAGQEGLGWKLGAPTSTTTAPSGLGITRSTLYSATTGAPIETRAPHATEIKEYALPSGSYPWGITVGPENNLWFTDASGKVASITSTGTIKEYAANKDFPVGIISGPDGNLWFTELLSSNVNHITTSGTLTTHTLTRSNAYTAGIATGSDKNLWFTEYGTGYIGKVNTKSEVLGEYALPSKSEPSSIASGPDGNLWFTDEGTSKIGKITTSGTITEYALPAGSKPYSITSGPEKSLWFTEPGTSKIGKITTSGTITEYTASAGEPRIIAAGPENELWYTASKANKVAEFTPGGETTQYSLPAGSSPWGIVAGPENTIWFTEEEGNKIGRIAPKAHQAGNQQAVDSQTIYYSAGSEASVAACRSHPEWANLPCQTQPAHQPEVSGLPELPVTTYTYNLYDEPEVTKSTSGSSTRTETDAYDAAGRLTSKELTSSIGTAMPKVSYQYNSETGGLEKQAAGEHTITSIYNTLGELTSYTDANEGTSTYKYDADGRTIEEATPYGSQTYSYNETTGLETKLTDSTAGTFTATYDQEGNLASETLPDGLTACYTRNATSEATAMEYRKAKSCQEGSVWFSDSATPTIHGQSASQTSSLSSETYAYDEAGRLTEVQETPAGKGCTVRLYGLDEDGNRTSLTTRAPGTEGKCATEGGTIQSHTYDTANQLTDTGTTYNAFGDITSLPASDAGGSTLESHYYADGQPAEQTQEGVTLGYQLDPARRDAEITTTSSKDDSALIDHYSSEGSSPAWTTETSGKWTRYIFGISDSLAAIQTDAEKPVLQLADLHGDIIGTAADEEAATKLLSSTNSTEYGVPTTGGPPRYSWLGTQELPTEFPSGVLAMGARSYVPQLGRFLQPDPKPGGSANAYAYTYGNPLNETDPSGEWSLNETSGELSAVGTGEGIQLPGGTGIAAGAIMPAPVNTQLEAAFWASPPWDQETAGNEEYEEYEEEWEEEGEEEYASNQQGTEMQTESGVLTDPLERVEGGKGESEAGSRIFVLGGCPNIHDPCYPKHGKKHASHKAQQKQKCALPPNVAGIAYCQGPGAEEPPRPVGPVDPPDPGGPAPSPGWAGDPEPVPIW